MITNMFRRIGIEVIEKPDDDKKDLILRSIEDIPGVRHRELLRLTGLSNGVLTYHLSTLYKLNQIRIDRQKSSKMTRYYTVNIPSNEISIIGYFRNNTTRQIIIFLLEHDLCTFNEIVDNIKKAPSTISWHLKRLREAQIISIRQGNEYQLYTLTNSESVAQILYKYKESFVDRIVNNYAEMIEDL
jgi:predicted transcriptional regulator